MQKVKDEIFHTVYFLDDKQQLFFMGKRHRLPRLVTDFAPARHPGCFGVAAVDSDDAGNRRAAEHTIDQ